MPCQPVPVYWMDFMLLTPIAVAAARRTLDASWAEADPANSTPRLNDRKPLLAIIGPPVRASLLKHRQYCEENHTGCMLADISAADYANYANGTEGSP